MRYLENLLDYGSFKVIFLYKDKYNGENIYLESLPIDNSCISVTNCLGSAFTFDEDENCEIVRELIERITKLNPKYTPKVKEVCFKT